ncbi:MAG: tetratricopeptide repeat protein, partial [Candidatus Omnitrophica bacterium]|nr:tetratricopeptide repeat protein [Candidatus Omnitrophota bacterium]
MMQSSLSVIPAEAGIQECRRKILSSALVLALCCLIAPPTAIANNDLAKIRGQRQLELEGKALFRQGKYDEALQKFQESCAPKYELYKGRGNGYAESYIREIYVMRGEYEKALEHVTRVLKLPYMQEILKKSTHDNFTEEKLEYEALIKARDTGSWQPVYDFIDYLKKTHHNELPPNGYNLGSITPISTILRLYDTIGDHDAGIAYVDMILDWTFEVDKPEFSHINRNISSEEAEKYMKIKKLADGKPNKEWRVYKWLREYLLVREAFEQDKREGTRGRATQALIQSDY